MASYNLRTVLKMMGQNILNWVKSNCVNNLLSTATNLPLAAAQGKVLDEKIDKINQSLANLQNNNAIIIENGGGILYETLSGNMVEVSICGQALEYDVLANTYLTTKGIKNPPSIEQPFCAFGSDAQIHYIRLLTSGRLYSPYSIPKGVTLSGVIRFVKP